MRPLKILDRYILKNFLGTFVVTELVVLILATIVDMSEKIDKYLTNQAPASEIATYYLNFALYYGNMYMSLVVFLAATIFTSKFAARSEIIAIMSAGVNYNRFLRPYLYGAVLLTVLSLLINNFILPYSNIRRLDFEARYVKPRDDNYLVIQDIHKQVGPGQIIYIKDWNVGRAVGSYFTFEQYDSTGTMTHKFSSEHITYDRETSRYRLTNYFSKDLREDGSEDITSGYTIDTVFAFTPADFSMDKHVGDKKNSIELEKLIRLEQQRGSPDVRTLITERYKRVALPFSSIILTVLAVALCSRKKRGGTGINIAIGIVLMAAYLFMLRVFETTAAKSTDGSPLFWIWLPNILFAGIAYYLYRHAKK